jgi:hypothetical protein
MKSLRIKITLTCLLLIGATTAGFAADHEFRGVVHAIETNYGVHHMHIPLLGVALLFVRPEGVSGLRLAVFEGFQTPAAAEEVTRVVENSLGPGWFPFVRVRSKGDGGNTGETTLIYANPSGGKLRMMIVNLEPSEATVVELNLSDRAIKGWLKEPGEKAEGESSHHHFD